MRESDTIPSKPTVATTAPVLDVPLLALYDLGRLRKCEMAVSETGSSRRHLDFRLSANVGQCRQCHRRVKTENVIDRKCEGYR